MLNSWRESYPTNIQSNLYHDWNEKLSSTIAYVRRFFFSDETKQQSENQGDYYDCKREP